MTATLRLAGLLVALAVVLMVNIQLAATVFPDTAALTAGSTTVTGPSATTIVTGVGERGCE